MNSLPKRTRENFFAVSNLKLIFMTKNNIPTNLKETNSNRSNRRSLIGHHRMANLLRLISLLKNARIHIPAHIHTHTHTHIETVNIGYSINNIPNAQPQECLKCFIDKTESLLYAGCDEKYSTSNTQAIGQTKKLLVLKPPGAQHNAVREMNEFEDNCSSLSRISSSTEDVANSIFQRKLSQDVNKNKKDKKLLITADKTTNFNLL